METSLGGVGGKIDLLEGKASQVEGLVAVLEIDSQTADDRIFVLKNFVKHCNDKYQKKRWNDEIRSLIKYASDFCIIGFAFGDCGISLKEFRARLQNKSFKKVQSIYRIFVYLMGKTPNMKKHQEILELAEQNLKKICDDLDMYNIKCFIDSLDKHDKLDIVFIEMLEDILEERGI